MDIVERAVRLLKSGELVAFPTDTVYGVGAICWDEKAVAKLYAAKLRSNEKAIPILLADPEDLSLVARNLPAHFTRIAEAFWPGPLTLIVPASPRIPREVTAGGDTVAVRVPDHAIARSLIRAAGAPLATTSANLSGQVSPVTAEDVEKQLAGRIALIVNGGPCPGGTPSTVLDITSGELRIVRAGPITLEQISASML